MHSHHEDTYNPNKGFLTIDPIGDPTIRFILEYYTQVFHTAGLARICRSKEEQILDWLELRKTISGFKSVVYDPLFVVKN